LDFRRPRYLSRHFGEPNPTDRRLSSLPSTQTFQPSATGFFVYSADLKTQTLPSNGGASNSDLLTLNKGLLQGAYVVAFLDSSNATANSGAILETKHMSPIPEASTWAMLLLASHVSASPATGRRRAAGYGRQSPDLPDQTTFGGPPRGGPYFLPSMLGSPEG
jgi:hypothetical protein